MKRLFPYIACLMFVFFLAGCIKNDIPYPRIQASFTSMTVEDQLSAPVIDSLNRTVTINLNEKADIEAVKILSYTLTPNAFVADDQDISVLDLTKPVNVVLGLYQDYVWTIKAVQNINRYVVVQGQIGSSLVDTDGRRVVFTIPDNIDVKNVYVDSIKLGQEGSTMSPDLNGQFANFERGIAINVSAFGRTQTWHVYATVTKTTVFTTQVDAWTNVVWAYGEAEAGKNNGFQYRLANSPDWTDVPKEWITFNGGNMTARIIHLQPETEYAVRAYSNDEFGAELTCTTQAAVQMPDSSFDDWSLNGKIWQPWAEGQTPYWDTGNKGATTLGTSNVMPTTDTSTGTGQAALLKTEFKGIGGTVGKLGAGSLFAGYYVKTDGTNGILSFGRTFTQRPTKLTGWFKYHTEPITDATTGLEYMKGRPDTCIMWVALIDSAEPFEIRTNPNNRHLFNPDGPEVIAYGAFQVGHDVTDWSQFEVVLNYKSTSRIPNYILCVTSSSKYGDYFTGARGAELYIDDFKLLFDY